MTNFDELNATLMYQEISIPTSIKRKSDKKIIERHSINQGSIFIYIIVCNYHDFVHVHQECLSSALFYILFEVSSWLKDLSGRYQINIEF